MARSELPKTLVQSIVARLLDDMRRRNLRRGDRYLTAAEASAWLHASPVTVNRAMQILADDGLLVRRRSRGTFVGPNFRSRPEDDSILEVLHLVMAMDYHESRAMDSDRLVDAVQAVLPGSTIEIHYLPAVESLRSTERIVHQLRQSDAKEGLVLIRASHSAQKLVEEFGVPAVVYGQVYPGVSLDCVGHDQEAVGRFMAEYAVEHGHRRFALIAHHRWMHGDNLMIAGLSKRLSAAGCALDDLMIHSVLPEREMIAAAVERCLTDPEPPTMFFCRSDGYSQTVYDLLQERQVQGTQVISGGHGLPRESPQFARIISQWSLERQMKQLVEFLEARATGDGGTETVQQVTIPVQLEGVLPSEDGDR